MSIYTELRDAGVPLDHYESDLYAKVTPESREILERSPDEVHTFLSKLDGALWYDIPFAYDPFWERKPR